MRLWRRQSWWPPRAWTPHRSPYLRSTLAHCSRCYVTPLASFPPAPSPAVLRRLEILLLRKVAGITEHTGRVMTERKTQTLCVLQEEEEEEEEEEDPGRGWGGEGGEVPWDDDAKEAAATVEQFWKSVAGLGTKKSTNWRWSDKGASRRKNWSCESSRKSEKTKETYHDIMRFFVNGVRGYGKSSCFPYATLSHLSFFFIFVFSSSFFLFFSLLPNLSYYHLSSAFLKIKIELANFRSLGNLANFFSRKWEKHE